MVAFIHIQVSIRASAREATGVYARAFAVADVVSIRASAREATASS